MITVEDLAFSYDNNYILEDLNLNIKNGHIYGLIGPNGSGKTTLLNCLVSFYYPDSGMIAIEGKSIENNKDYLKEAVLLGEDYYVGMFNIIKLAKKLSILYSKPIDYLLLEELLNKFNLSRTDILKRLSKGNRKLAIICVVLSLKPKYLFLDEFLDGIDIVNRRYIKDYLLEYVIEKNAVIVISSHATDDIKDICDELIMIKDKTIKLQDNIDDFKRKYKTYQIVSDFEVDKEYFIKLGVEVNSFKKLDNIYWISVNADFDIDEKINIKEFKDFREIKSSIEEVIYYEFTS